MLEMIGRFKWKKISRMFEFLKFIGIECEIKKLVSTYMMKSIF